MPVLVVLVEDVVEQVVEAVVEEILEEIVEEEILEEEIVEEIVGRGLVKECRYQPSLVPWPRRRRAQERVATKKEAGVDGKRYLPLEVSWKWPLPLPC